MQVKEQAGEQLRLAGERDGERVRPRDAQARRKPGAAAAPSVAPLRRRFAPLVGDLE